MATRRWLGGALPVAQVETISVGGTWATSDTATISINGRDLRLTVGATTTLAEVCVQLARMLGDASTAMGTGYSASERGPNVAEFREFSVAAGATTVVLTGATKGKPFQIAVAKNSAAGTIGTSTSVEATGPNHWDNPANWSGGAVPADGDDVVFDSGAIDCKYALQQSSTSPASLRITMGYTGQIGLPAINQESASSSYPEYRPRYLALGNAGDGTNLAVTIGEHEGPGSSRIMLDCGTGQATLMVHNTGQPPGEAEQAVQWKGTHASNAITISKGSLAVAWLAGETALVQTLNVGYRTNVLGDARVCCGAGAAISTVNQSGGVLTTCAGITQANVTGGELHHLAGPLGTLNLARGAVRYRSSGTLGSARVSAHGALDFRQDMRPRAVTNCDLFEGAALHDPSGTATFANGIDLNHCTPADVTLDLPAHLRLNLGNAD